MAPGDESPDPTTKPAWRRTAALTAITIALGLAVGGVAAWLLLPGGAEPPASLEVVEPGPDPFLALIEADLPPPLVPVLTDAVDAADAAAAEVPGDDGEATRARLIARRGASVDVLTEAGYLLIRPRSVVGAAIVPEREAPICDVDQMVDAYRADPVAAAAFGAVMRLEPDELAGFLTSLTPGYLIDDTAVVNHSYSNEVAHPYRTSLVAGTAVMVDADGLPRVRCRGASPLVPALVELGDTIVGHEVFADELVTAEIGPDVPPLTDNSIDGLLTDDPEEALGPPDGVAVSLDDDPNAAERCRFSVTLRFADNRLVDGPGPDLLIVELGRAESMYVWIGVDENELRPLGEVAGGESAIDIGAATGEDERFGVVRLCDGPDTGSEVPGSDIDAVAALNSVPAEP